MTSATYTSLENIVNHMISNFNENSEKLPLASNLNCAPRISLISHTSTDNGIIDESKTETYVITYRILGGSILKNPKLLEELEPEATEYLRILIDNLLVKSIHQMHEDLNLYPLKEITLESGSYNKILHDTEGSYLYLIKYSDRHLYITLTSSEY